MKSPFYIFFCYGKNFKSRHNKNDKCKKKNTNYCLYVQISACNDKNTFRVSFVKSNKCHSLPATRNREKYITHIIDNIKILAPKQTLAAINSSPIKKQFKIHSNLKREQADPD